MAGYKYFQVNRNKAFKGINIFAKNNNFNNSTKNLTKSERLMNGIALWCSYYRYYPHIFVEEYFGIRLKLFQKILIFFMMHYNYFMYFAARGQGKTWLTAVFCCVRATLYPETKIVIASKTKSQAREVIEKIDDMRKSSPNLAREISYLTTNTNDPRCEFHNGSWIKIVASNENARSKRANVLIVDEFRMVDLKIINRVLRKFLTAPRQPGYLQKPEYKHLQERNKELYLSSCWYKYHWSWERFKTYFHAMINNKKYFVCGLPYQLSVAENLLMKEQVLDEMSEDDFDEISWLMEMECLFFGESEKAFFRFEDINKNRKLVKPFLPANMVEYLSKKEGKYEPKKDGEIRIIGVDVALMGGNENDNTVFLPMRLLPTSTGYERQVPYIETMNGKHSTLQAIRLKQLYEDFDADFVVMDTYGNGMSIYDDCVKVLYDEERDKEYDAWTCINDEKMSERALSSNALPVIYSIKAGAQLNHEMAVKLRDAFQKRKIKLLVNEIEGKDFYKEKYKSYKSLSLEEQNLLLLPYIQTTFLINEMVNLEYEVRNGLYRLKEMSGKRKDRYSSLAMANYYASILEKDLLMDNESDPNDPLVYY